MNATASGAPRPRRGRLLRLLAILAAVLLVLVLVAGWLLQPQRAVGFVLSRVGAALGLEIAFGDAGYRLRGTPQLVVHDLVAREPGAKTAMLRAERMLLAVPWSTLRARGAIALRM